MVRKLGLRETAVTTSMQTGFSRIAALSHEVHRNDGVKPDHLHGLSTTENHRLKEIYKEEELNGGLPSEIRLRTLERLLDELVGQESYKHIKLIETEIRSLREDLASRNGHRTNGEQLHTELKPSAATVIGKAFTCFKFLASSDSEEVIQLIQDLNQFPNELGARDALWKLTYSGIDKNILCADNKAAVKAVDRALDILGARYSYNGEHFSDITGRAIAAYKIAVMCLEKSFMFDDVYRFDTLAFDLSVYDGQMGNSVLLLSLANKSSPRYEIRTSTVGSFISRIERQNILLGNDEVATAFFDIVSSKVINHDSTADRLAEKNLIKAINVFSDQRYHTFALKLLFKGMACGYKLPPPLMQKVYDNALDRLMAATVHEKSPEEFLRLLDQLQELL